MFFRINHFKRIILVMIVIFTLVMLGSCKKGSPEVFESIVLDIGQSVWNLNSSSGSEILEISLVGQVTDKIILNTIQLKGDNPSASPLNAINAVYQNQRVFAEFLKQEVSKILLNPTEGSTHNIMVIFQMMDSSEPKEVHSTVTINDEIEDGGSNDFELEIDPDEWNLNFTNSSGTVEVFIEGEGIENIDLDTIEMMGDNSSASALQAESVSINNDHIHARFAKNQVINLLDNPSDGSVHTITISFHENNNSEILELSSEIEVVGDDEIELSDLELEIDPDEWNLNFTNSSGTVEVFIEGEGIENIDLNSIEMMGDNPSASALQAQSVSINNNHIHARFPKNQVINLLDNPSDGSVHTIIVRFLDANSLEQLELTTEITIEGEDEVEPSNFELEIHPDNWNLNYSKSSGTVEAFIEGEGIENIDLNSIEMKGDNPSTPAVQATSVSRNKNRIHAHFAKNQVIDLLLNPADGSSHLITVSFTEIGSSVMIELTAQISVKGKDDD